MVQAELGYGEIYLTIAREIPDPVPIPSDKAEGLDIGVIHLFKRSRHGPTRVAAAQTAQSRTTPGQPQSGTGDAQCVVSGRDQIVAFCVTYGISLLYAGGLGTLNHKKRRRRSRRTNQDVRTLEFLGSHDPRRSHDGFARNLRPLGRGGSIISKMGCAFICVSSQTGHLAMLYFYGIGALDEGPLLMAIFGIDPKPQRSIVSQVDFDLMSR